MSIEDIIAELKTIDTVLDAKDGRIDDLERDVVILKEDRNLYKKATDAARSQNQLVEGFLNANRNLVNVTQERDHFKAGVAELTDLCEKYKQAGVPRESYHSACEERDLYKNANEEFRARVAELQDLLNSKEQTIDGQAVLIDTLRTQIQELAKQNWDLKVCAGKPYGLHEEVRKAVQENRNVAERLRTEPFDIVRDGKVIRVVEVKK